ncbi:MAG TPA: tetratricopeptide repeat protein [Thermomonas sp.]|nr:tetratricopeptide repeat protein [Thermomonas sp.]
MTGIHRRAALALALACAACTPAFAQDAAQVDVGRMWDTFLAKATPEDVNTALDVLDAVDYGLTTVDADKCRANASAVARAQERAPVSVAVQRAALLCAEAVGDHAAAERATTMIAALARQAFRDADRGAWPRPVRIVSPADAYALFASAGFEFKYEMYPQLRPTPYFPLVIAAASQAGVERVVQFDYVDVLQAIDRADAAHGTPRLRMAYAESFVDSAAKREDISAVDVLAVEAALGEDDPAKRVEALRGAARAGGLHAATTWLGVCVGTPFKGCADGLVDALLPLAEARHAYPMMLLATAYLEGVGVTRDQASAEAMLDAADRQWERRGASVSFAGLQSVLHAGQPLAPFLRQRLDAAHAAGNPEARVLAVAIEMERADGKYALSAADEALLADPAHNGTGQGLLKLAAWYEDRDKAVSDRYLKRAAEANNPAALRILAMRLREAEGNRPASAETIAWLEKAANGNDAVAMGYLAWRALEDGKPRRAEDWLMLAGVQGDINAMFFLASLWSGDYKDLSGDAERAVKVYESLAMIEGQGPRARRALAALAIEGRGMPKDLARARAWLTQDAEAGDQDAQVELGARLLGDTLGATDEAAGRKWLERAITAGSVDAMNQYGLWLHNDGKDAADRARGVQLSRQAAEKDDAGALNNLAWMLCTSVHEDVRKPTDGMPYVARLEAIPDLGPGAVDTLAACYAAVGQYPRAVALQQQVVADMRKRAEPDLGNIKEMEARLALYRAGKPYIEQPAKR